MSGLTAEQRQKIEANRKKALALRGNRATSSSFSSPGTVRKTDPLPRTNQSNNMPEWLGAKTSNSVAHASTSTSSSGPKTSASSGLSSENVQKTTTNFYSISKLAQKRSTTPKKASYYAEKYGKKKNTDVTSPKKAGVLKGKCVLTSKSRFTVEVGYCAVLIDLFKSMNTKQYDMQTRQWSFDLQEYNTLTQQMRVLSDTVIVEPLPLCVTSTFSSSIRGEPSRPKPAPDDLSTVNQYLVERLLPFQTIGVQYAISHKGRVMIADDMGLGKTIQALCVAAYYREEWPLLIVVPSSVRFAWREQILRFLPDVDPQEINVVVTGKDSCTSGLINILSYDLMVRQAQALNARHFRTIIMDESHFLKNNKTARTKTAMPLLKNASRVLLLSGTPALSRPSELFPQISAIQPRLFPKFHDFGVRYCNAKQMQWGWDYSGSSHLGELQLVLEENIMIRRLKKDVLSELPSKIRQMVILDSSAVKINKSMKLSHKQVDQAKGMDRRGALLSYFHDTAEAKIVAVRGYILDMLESGSKILVFAHHQSILDSLEQAVKKDYGFIRIDGRTSAEQRNNFCEKFQKNDAVKVALLSITAANAGLNLTAAKLVVFAELFWNPGILVQAEDRAHRIGQNDSVSVHYLVATGTADDFIWPLVQQKLNVLGKAGLSKEDFAEADTKHIRDPLQRDIMSYFEESFMEDDLPENIPEANSSTEPDVNQGTTEASTSGTLLQHFASKVASATDNMDNKSLPGSTCSADDNCSSGPSSDWMNTAPESTNDNAVADIDGTAWIDDDDDDDFGNICDYGLDEDPDEPWPKKPRLC